MRHAVDHRKLGRDPGHRKALLRNLMNALVRSERIETTVAKAKELRRLADRIITLGKRNTTAARRRVFSMLSDKANTERVFSGLAARFEGRAGGYTRIMRTAFRAGDGSEMAIIEYLPAEERKAGGRKGRKKAAAKKTGGRGKEASREKPAEPAKRRRTRKEDKEPGGEKASGPGEPGKPKARPKKKGTPPEAE